MHATRALMRITSLAFSQLSLELKIATACVNGNVLAFLDYAGTSANIVGVDWLGISGHHRLSPDRRRNWKLAIEILQR